MRTLFDSNQSHESKSEHEFYAAMRIKTHLDNALDQIIVVCFKHDHELVIAESPVGYIL